MSMEKVCINSNTINFAQSAHATICSELTKPLSLPIATFANLCAENDVEVILSPGGNCAGGYVYNRISRDTNAVTLYVTCTA
jgi:hypothetical protein